MIALVENWRAVLTRAWSVRLIVLAAALSGAEVAFQMLDASILGLPVGAFAALSAATSSLALAARIIAQKDVSDAPGE